MKNTIIKMDNLKRDEYDSRMKWPNKCKLYIVRLFRFSHMDFEVALWQMIYLLIAPWKVYRMAVYYNDTKNSYSRDDPAFLVLLAGIFVVCATGLSLVLGLSFVAFLKFLLWVVFVDCVGVGIIMASIMWFFIQKKYSTAHELCSVEWGYAFDVHLNAFFPSLLIIHLFQLFFFHILIDSDRFLSTLFGNTLWLISASYYVYITFLGYANTLKMLNKVKLNNLLNHFVFCFGSIVLIYLFSLYLNFNICQRLMDFYHYRVAGARRTNPVE